jgi:uncharacterized membrane protein YhaH (DUF805 family)
MNWFLKALKQYATFSGRARRSEYWYFFLFYIIFTIGLVFIDSLLGMSSNLGILSSLFALGMLLPSIAVSVRRLHDTDRSGWWMLLCFVPLIGGIVLLVFFVQDSQAGANRFGESPKA